MRVLILTIFLMGFLSDLKAQKDVTTFGIGGGLLIPVKILEGDDVVSFDDSDSLTTTIAQKNGYRFGMNIRHGFSKTWAIETGIHYTRRNYDMSGVLVDGASVINDMGDMGVVCYEIPVTALAFVRITDNLYMDVAAGPTFDFFISDYRTNGLNFKQYTSMSPRINISLLANVGLEWRTEESGGFYLGANFNRPFFDVGQTEMVFYDSNGYEKRTYSVLNGNYVSIEFKYFFHEDPQKKVKKKKKEK